MNEEPHKQAQELASRAGLELQRGNRAAARQLYSAAADHERAALASVGPRKPRTLSIIGVSYVSLLYKAGRYEEGERAVYQLLASDEILDFGRRDLRELLEVIFDEQSIPAGYQYSGDELIFTLRGGEVGFGTAPFDLILYKGGEVKNYLTRVVEYEAGYPFRDRGQPAPDVTGALQTRATQPLASSYKFSLRVVEPRQKDLFERPRIEPARAIDTALEVVRLASRGSAQAHRELTERVADPQYRATLLKMVRNMAPSKDGFREFEVSRRGAEPGDVERVTLGPGSAECIREVLHHEQPTRVPVEKTERIEGILRALHLDKKWLVIVRDGTEIRCKTPPSVLDDVVGPMVNRKVLVTARRTKRGGNLEVIDIEPSG